MTNEEFERLAVGDIVMCNKEGRYFRTKPGIRCKIIGLGPGLKNNLLVEIIDGVDAGEWYNVCSEYFEIVAPLIQVEETEIFSLLV